MKRYRVEVEQKPGLFDLLLGIRYVVTLSEWNGRRYSYRRLEQVATRAGIARAARKLVLDQMVESELDIEPVMIRLKGA